MMGRSSSLEYLFSCLHFDNNSLRLFKRLSPENKMWYFVFKQSMQFLEPGKHGLALSRILHSSDTWIFLLFWFHIKLDNSVAFCLFSYLKEFLCLYSLVFCIFLQSLINYILHSYIVLYIIYTLASVGFELSVCCGSLTVTFNKYISLLYLKRHFCNAIFLHRFLLLLLQNAKAVARKCSIK